MRRLWNEQLGGRQDRGTEMLYITGFVLSVLLTLAAYFLVTENAFGGGVLIAAIVGLAVLQVFVQMFFFLHLGREPHPRWKLAAFSFMLLVLGIVVGGSLWIMSNLDYNMMRQDVQEYNSDIQQEERINY